MKNPSRLCLLVVAATALAASAASAQSISNGSYENGSIPSGDYCYISAPGCTISDWSGSAASVLATSFAWGTPAGHGNSALIDGTKVIGLQMNRFIEQEIPLPAGTYTISWVDAARAGYDSQTYNVSLGAQTSTSFFTTGEQAWAPRSATFSLSSSSPVILKFTGIGNQYDGTAFIDNVTIAAVPEPGALAMMAAGLTGIGLMRRRAATKKV